MNLAIFELDKPIHYYGAEFVVPFSPRSCFFFALKLSTCENIATFHSNDDLLSQYLFLNEKSCHLMTFSWQLESERTSGKTNHKFLALFMRNLQNRILVCMV